MRVFKRIVPFILALALFTGCASFANVNDEAVPMAGNESGQVEVKNEAQSAVEKPETEEVPAAEPEKLDFGVEASGEKLSKNDYAVIDYSNVEDGYVMVKYTAETEKRLKAQVKGPGTTYTYNIKPGEWAVFPLSDGNGNYKIGIYENAYDTKYSSVLSCQFDVELSDEFAPFLRPNQYVDYSVAPNALAKAAELTEGIEDTLEMVSVVYDYTVNSLVYDTERAATVKSGYLPVIDSVMAEGKGICFDYAALITGMLRSRGVPCKLVVGYAGSVYHAWISVWTAEEGWVDGVIFFDGSSWHRMDPTFDSGSNDRESILGYINNDSNYVEKYIY